MLKDLVVKNRSYRGFSQDFTPTREDLLELCDLARQCPSSVNMQPFKYYLANTPEQCAVIQPLTGWARRLMKVMTIPREGHCPTAFIVICQDLAIAANKERFLKDVGIVAQTMLLGAVEKGFCGIMIGNFSPEKVAEALGLGENLWPLLIVALGRPDEEVVLTGVPESGDVGYTRDENHVTYVPKRALEDIVIN